MEDKNNQSQTPNSTEENVFRTDDVNLASYIKAEGGTLMDIGLLSGGFIKRYYFAFTDVETCEKLKMNFLNGTNDKVSVRAFIEAREMFVNRVKSLSMGFQ